MVFTASDGTQFEDRNAWRKYEFETNYTFRNRKGETLMKCPGAIQGQPFDISDLEECEVLLLDHCDQVQIDNLVNCRVFVGPSSESVFVRNCVNCVFTIACKQLRTRDCSQCNIYLYSLTDPIIETSQQIQFAPFNGAYHGIKQHFEAARLEPSNNHWSQVYDFNDPDKSGKNWSLMREEGEPWTIRLENHLPNAQSLGPSENPVPRDAAFVQYTEEGSSGAMQSFSIATSQKEEAQAAFNQVFIPETNLVPPPPSIATEVVSQPPAAPVPAGQSWPLIEKHEKEFAEELTRKEAVEQALVTDRQKKAEEDVDKYYDERTDKLANRAAVNRTREAEKIEGIKLSIEKADGNPWSRVTDMIDTSSIKSKKTTSNNEDGTTTGENLDDVSRMKNLLVQLKNSSGVKN